MPKRLGNIPYHDRPLHFPFTVPSLPLPFRLATPDRNYTVSILLIIALTFAASQGVIVLA